MSSMGAKIMGVMASSWTCAVGISDAHLSAPLCPRRVQRGRWQLGQPLPPVGPVQLGGEEAVGLDDLSVPPNFNRIAVLPELQLSANPILGGGAYLPAPSGLWWEGSACPLPTPTWEDLGPGPAARLLFEMSPVGGTLAWFRCSGLKVDGFVRGRSLFPSVQVLVFVRGNLPRENPSVAPHRPEKAVPAPEGPQGLLGPGPGRALSPSLLQTHRVGCTSLCRQLGASGLLLLLPGTRALSPHGSLNVTSSRRPPLPE